MAANQAQNAWIIRVLGVTPGAAVSGSTDAQQMWESTRAIWFDASERADAQLAALQRALRASDDEELRQIGEMGLNAVTGNHKVRLLAAIQDIEGRGQPDAGKIAKLRQIADGFIEHLASDVHVDAAIVMLAKLLLQRGDELAQRLALVRHNVGDQQAVEQPIALGQVLRDANAA